MNNKIVNFLTKALVFCLCCFLCIGVLNNIALPAFAIDNPNEGGGGARITDLAGTTWFIPSGWHAIYAYGLFHVNLIEVNDELLSDYLSIGYRSNNSDSTHTPVVDVITINGIVYTPSDSLYIRFFDNSSNINDMLITWLNVYGVLVGDNTFGIYNPANQHIVAVYQFDDGMTWSDWVNSEYNIDNYSIVSGVKESQIGLNDNIKNYVVSAVTDTTDIYNDVRILMTTAGTDQYSDTPIQSINYMLGVMRLYKPCYSLGFDAGYIVGDEDGYRTGYDMGFADGLYQGESSAIGENLIGSGFNAITQSLNQIILYQSSTGVVVTLWVVICGAIGIALFIWVLKLFAGG